MIGTHKTASSKELGNERGLRARLARFFVNRKGSTMTGNLGIGVTPSYLLDLKTATESERFINFLFTDDSTVSGPVLRFDKIRGDAIVEDGDTVFHLIGRGYDGANYRSAAQIRFMIDGTPGTNDMPGKISFLTTTDDTSVATQKMQLDNAGILRVGDSDNNTQIAANGDQSFAGTAGFYPRVLSQAAAPAAGTGPTQCDTGEFIIWEDSDNTETWLVYNRGGTVKGIKVETL